MSDHVSNALHLARSAAREVEAALDALPAPIDTQEAVLERLLWPGARPEDVARRRLGMVAELLAKAEEILESMR